MDVNKMTYQERKVVLYYLGRANLQKPEETILDMFRTRLGNMRMLDIGVGGGRTTCHFALLTKEYVGTDYSDSMISACRERFPNARQKGISFEVLDVRAMNIFPNESFDFIMFSFNGIDCLSHEDRLKALQEIKRVAKRSAYFFFSTHNLSAFRRIPISRNPIKLAKNLLRYLRLRKNTEHMDYSILPGGEIGEFKTELYHIKGSYQLKQLGEAGFTKIRSFSLSGEEITDHSTLDDRMDLWLHFLCQV
jgi:ubiquinone/menaquinone biosynthesis C-methylase UbiE